MTVVESESESKSKCTTIIKLEKAHDRPIVRMFFLATYKYYSLVTVAHDSLKMWNVIDDEGECRFQQVVEASKWRCGVQSADMKSSTSEIVVVGLDSVFYRIAPEIEPNIENLRVDAFDLGYMETWFCALDDSSRTCLTTSYSGNITEIDIAGPSRAEITRKEVFPNVKQVCCMAYSNNNRTLAIANNDGIVTIFDHDTLKVKYPVEVHAMKIRAMLFTGGDEYLLTGSDDKSIRLSQIGVDKSSSLVRQFCGHKAAITGLSIDPTSGGARFASCCMFSEIFLWDINSPKATHNVKSPHEGIINSVLFSHNGHHLFSGGEDKRLVCYRIPQVGEPILTITESAYPENDESEKENVFGDSPEQQLIREPSETPTGGIDESMQDATVNEDDLDDV